MMVSRHGLDTAELNTYDWRIVRPPASHSVHPDIVLVEINDAALRNVTVAGR